MDLQLFFFEAGVTKTRVAKDLGISLQHLSSVAKRRLKPSDDLALRIEIYTRGLVTAEELLKGWEKPEKRDPLEVYFEKKQLIA